MAPLSRAWQGKTFLPHARINVVHAIMSIRAIIDILIVEATEVIRFGAPLQGKPVGSWSDLPPQKTQRIVVPPAPPPAPLVKKPPKKPARTAGREEYYYECPHCGFELKGPSQERCPRCKFRTQEKGSWKLRSMIVLPPEMQQQTHKVNVMPSGAVVRMPVKKKPAPPASMAKTVPIGHQPTKGVNVPSPTLSYYQSQNIPPSWQKARDEIRRASMESRDSIEEAIDEILEANRTRSCPRSH